MSRWFGVFGVLGKFFLIEFVGRSGAVLIEGLNIAEKLDMNDPDKSLSYHYLVEYAFFVS